MSAIRVGCQTYTWEMLGSKWQGGLEDILDAVADAGYEGIEISNAMIGDYETRPDALANALERRGLTFAAYACASPHGWTNPAYRDAEMALAERALRVAASFPGCSLGVSGASSPSRRNLETKLRHACELYNAIGRHGRKLGVLTHVHPHSHHGSILESAEEYACLMEWTDPEAVAFGPDTGHIVRGGQDLVTTLERHLGRIRHLHFKDATAAGTWVPIGRGVCDFGGVLKRLHAANYPGWIICEEESDDARTHPAEAILRNREALEALLSEKERGRCT